MKHTRSKNNGMTRHMRMLAILMVPVVALILGAAALEGWAQDDPPVCWFNIELNATDLDVGVRGFFDFDPWNDLTIQNPNGDEIADVMASNGLADQGFAEWFFESGEPMLGDGEPPYTFAIFLARFPESGEDDFYVFTAVPNAGDSETCYAEFTHVIPCAPEISAAGNRGLGVTISWDPVTQVVDTAATDASIALGGEEVECVTPASALVIKGYEVIVETEVDGEDKRYTIELPGDATRVKVPPEFIALGDEFQYEVLAIEDSGNQTITEEDFCVNERNGRVVECPDE